jgi:hypothetical protein
VIHTYYLNGTIFDPTFRGIFIWGGGDYGTFLVLTLSLAVSTSAGPVLTFQHNSLVLVLGTFFQTFIPALSLPVSFFFGVKICQMATLTQFFWPKFPSPFFFPSKTICQNSPFLGGGAKSVATHLSTGYTFNGPAQNYHQLR